MKLVVLSYHKLHPEIRDDNTVTTGDFKRQIATLKKEGYNSISCKSLYNFLMKVGELPDNPVLITFDEGHISQYRHAIPILEMQGFQAVFFVTGEQVTKSSCLEKSYNDGYMNLDHLRLIQSIGFEIGIHGYTFMNFKDAELKEVRSNIANSILLFNKLELPVTRVVAYPFGAKPSTFWRTRKFYRMLKQEKILLAFSKGNRYNNIPDAPRFNLHRIEIKGKESEKKFLINIRE